MFNTAVRENVIKGNIQDYCDFVKKFTLPIEKDKDNIWTINNFPLIILKLQVNLTKNKKKEKKKKKDEGIPTETAF